MLENEHHRPNFFVIGAAKAGTTSLYHYLDQHPDVYLSPIKEPNYFSTDIDPLKFNKTYQKNNFLDVDAYFKEKPLQNIHLSFVRKEAHYAALFEEAHEKAVGECSTSYLYSAKAAQNIYDFNPDSRIIAVLRNPVERAYSHYLMALRFGYTALSFKEALEQDIVHKDKGWGISELFIELGQYHQQLKRYFDLFPKQQLKTILFDALKVDKKAAVNEIFSFLGLQNLDLKDEQTYNKASIPKYRFLNRVLTKSGLKKFLSGMLPESFHQSMKNKLFESGPELTMSEDDRMFLQEIYKDDILETAHLIGKDLSHWLI